MAQPMKGSKEQMIKLIQAASYIVGAMFVAYNITAFRIDKHGSYFFADKNQQWLALGVGLFALGMVIKNWRFQGDIMKIVEAASYVGGAMFVAYNITAFKIDRHGSYYFLDKNQQWLALGVGLFALGLVIKRWRRL